MKNAALTLAILCSFLSYNSTTNIIEGRLSTSTCLSAVLIVTASEPACACCENGTKYYIKKP
jgi:hypothetical protein